MDSVIQRLLKEISTTHDLSSAVQLVRRLKHLGMSDDTDDLIVSAHQVLAIGRRGDFSGDHDDLLHEAEAGRALAEAVLDYFKVAKPEPGYQPHHQFHLENGVVLSDGSYILPPSEIAPDIGTIFHFDAKGGLLEKRTPSSPNYNQWASMFYQWPAIGDTDESDDESDNELDDDD